MIVRIVNLIIVILECIGLYISFSNRRWGILIYYTQLSNIVTFVASLLLVIFGDLPFISVIRYVSTCMLIMTFMVTVFYLVPITKNVRGLLFSGSGLYHHLLCPIISTISYFALEYRAPISSVCIMPIITLIYGLTMLYLNAKGRADGPYPFFKINEMGVKRTVIWMVALMLVVIAISVVAMVI